MLGRMPGAPLRWKLADDTPASGQLALFNDVVEHHFGTGEFRGIEFLHVNARRIINEVPAASRMPFRFTINAYRGCMNSCVYCFARPTHEYLGLDAGRDFETKIVVKINAVERLRAELRNPKWQGELIAMGTNTDPYQRCEGKYRLTRGIIEVLTEARNPFSILTKGTLILRDLDVLEEAAKHTDVRTSFSIGTLDPEVWKASEPGTPHPRQRVAALAKLRAAGVTCSVLLAPIIPGISDSPEQLEEVVTACRDAGATSITPIVLHLRPGVREQFMPWLSEARPDLVADYQRRYPRSYADKAYQQRITDLVAELLGRRGGRGRGRTRSS
jgi:DNA repair photolyase